jgi:hypothetical protein
MPMLKVLHCLLFIGLIFPCLTSQAQGHKKKKHKNLPPERHIIAKYEGGSRNVIKLTLYSDSTFDYQEIGSRMGLKSTKMGAYLMCDSSISLYTWRSYEFLRNLDEKVRSSVFRCNQEKILMYTREQESSPDSSFYRSYYTLSRIE